MKKNLLDNFDKSDWDAFHDVLFNAAYGLYEDGVSFTLPQLEKLYFELPEELQAQALQWGMNDSPWRDSVYEWYQDNPFIVDDIANDDDDDVGMSKELKYEGWLKIYNIKDKNKNGVEINREVMSRASGNKSDDCVAGILYDPDKATLYFVKQYRAGTNEEDRYLLEVVAGTLEVGEDPKECFKREAMEEVGFECDDIQKCGLFYTSPGGTTERIHLFVAEGVKTHDGGGLASENEDIEVVEVDLTVENATDIITHDLKTMYLLNLIK